MFGEYRPSDILCVIHVCDSDGVFIPDESVVVDQTQTQRTTYTNEKILVNNQEQKQSIELRNREKREKLNIQQCRTCITYKGVEVPYVLYFLSRNLEDVFFPGETILDSEKEMRAVKFLDEVEGTDRLKGILEDVFPPVDKSDPNVYKASWEYIKARNHSLKRCSNLELMYSFIRNQITPK